MHKVKLPQNLILIPSMKIIFLMSALPSISLCFTSPLAHVEGYFKKDIKMQEVDNIRNTALKDVFLRPFGVIFVAASFVLNPGAVGAIESTSFFMTGSSSLHLAEDIKLLDTSMPSYSSISNPTAGKDSIEFVLEKKTDNTAGAAAGARKKSKSVKEQKKFEPRKRSEPEEIDLRANFKNRPVFRDEDVESGPMKEQKEVEPRKRSEPEEIDLRANFKNRPVFIDKEVVTIEEKRKEKELSKDKVKIAKKEKETVGASEETEEDGLSVKDVKVVDMNMPSYGDSTNKKAKSVFAL